MRNGRQCTEHSSSSLVKGFLKSYVYLLLYGNGSCTGRSLLVFFSGRMMFDYEFLRAQTGIPENLNY